MSGISCTQKINHQEIKPLSLDHKKNDYNQKEIDFVQAYNTKNHRTIYAPDRKKKLVVGRKYQQRKIYSTPVVLLSADTSKPTKKDTLVELFYQGIDEVAVDWMTNNQILIQCDSSFPLSTKDTLVTLGGEKIKIDYSHPSLKIKFDVFSDTIAPMTSRNLEEVELHSSFEYINAGTGTARAHNNIILGYEEDADNYIEAYDNEGHQVIINNQSHYQYVLDQYIDVRQLLPAESTKDTMDIAILYQFLDQGVYHLRFVDVLNDSMQVYSNWDLLVVE